MQFYRVSYDSMSEEHKSFTEEIKIGADKLVDTITDLVHEGNVRHIQVKNGQGEIVIEFPVTIGVVGVILAPFLAALGALAVVASDYTIVVTRDPKDGPPEPPVEIVP